jgi:hypothetical protein
MPLQAGQSSGDFRETSGRVQILHEGIRNSVGILTADAFTQSNPAIVAVVGPPTTISTQLSGITKKGVLGGTVAFTRPDAGNGYHGGPVQVGAAYVAGQKPLGLFINDSLGNAFENTPGVASGRGPYLCGRGTVAVSVWETLQQITPSATALTYTAGNKLYASVNGLLTNRIEDAYEYNVAAQNDPDFVTVVGIVKIAPDANNTLMVLDLRI